MSLQSEASTSAVPLEEPIEADMEIAAALGAGEEEYEIEAILNHDVGRFYPGEMAYLVSWKGYGEEDNSWVREVDAEGAREIIKEYWIKTPKTTIKKTGPAPKGRKSQAKSKSSPKRSLRAPPKHRSEAHTGTPSADEADETIDARLQEIANDPTLDDEQKAKLEKEYLEQQKLERMRIKYGRVANWDEIVKKIETVERNDQGKLIMFVLFNSGDRLAFENIVCHHRCPLKVIQFYESHLRFKTTDGHVEYRAPSPLPEPNGHAADAEMRDASVVVEAQTETEAPTQAPAVNGDEQHEENAT